MPRPVRTSTARMRRGVSTAVRQVLDHLRPVSLPIDLHAVARMANIPVITEAIPELDASGCLEHLGVQRFRILVSDRIRTEPERRDCLGHELGHVFLNGHGERMFSTGVHRHVSRHRPGESDLGEIEADLFGRELLMPAELCQGLVAAWDREEPGWATVVRLAETCQTTTAAAAVRYSELTRLSAATFTSQDCRIENGLLSSGLRRRLGWPSHRPVRGQPLPPYTPSPEQTNRVAALSDTQWMTSRRVRWTSWFGGLLKGWALETCHWLGLDGQVLTVLTELRT